MPYRVLADGSIAADTLDEALAIQARIVSQLRERSPETTRRATAVAVQSDDEDQDEAEDEDDAEHEPPAEIRPWRPRDVARLMRNAKLQDTIRVAVELGTGTSTNDYANALDVRPNGIGVRMRYVERVTHELDPGLPLPVVLVGDAGDKAIEIEPSFLEAFKVAFL